MSYAAPSVWLTEEIYLAFSVPFLNILAGKQIMCSFPEKESFLHSLGEGKTPAGWEFIPQGLTRTCLLGANSIYKAHLYMGVIEGVEGPGIKNASLGHTYGGSSEFLPTLSGFLKIYTPETAEWTEKKEEMCSLEELMFMQLVGALALCRGKWDDTNLGWRPKDRYFIQARNSTPHSEIISGYSYYPDSGWEVSGKSDDAKGWKKVFIPFKPRHNPLLVELIELPL